ncbi:zinc finger BED domain-containing protein 6-like isoform X2 [Stegodyphus dumicola]|uniref:zinc finger BED domain-containing protein 6-like isoform X2 n=1 Tax=Stegodyphus dumicola TaxID=202533 RepID=UPI0015B083AF|nr:zinc finger BED domain-containing protein 6-like isoform X2 [Stegodyphus dumicola]
MCNNYIQNENNKLSNEVVDSSEAVLEEFTLNNPKSVQADGKIPTKRFRTNPKQQKEVIEELFDKQKAVVTERSFMNLKGNKRFKSDVWSWFGDIKLLISRSEAKKLKIPYYIRYCGGEQMMLSKMFVACFKCTALFIHNSQKSGTSTLRAHMKVCSRPKSRRKRGSPTIIFFPSKTNNTLKDIAISDFEKHSTQDHIMNFILSSLSNFDIVENTEFQNLLQMCITIGATYGDVNIESMLCPQEKLSDFLLNDMYITSINHFYTEFQYIYGASYNINVWVEENKKHSFISLICYYSTISGELRSIVLHTDEFPYESKVANDAKNWFISFILSQPVVPFKRLIVTDNHSNMVLAFSDEQCIKCCVQNLNSALQKVVKGGMSNVQPTYQDFVSLVNKCINLVTNFGQLSIESKLFEPLKIPPDENWSSILQLLKSVHDHYEEILSILNQSGEIHLLSFDKYAITEIINFFRLFESALLELSSISEPTLNIVIPWIIKLKKHCLPHSSDSAAIQHLKKKLSIEIDEHLTKNVGMFHRIATQLDPRFKKLIFLPREDQIAANVKIKCLVKECMEAPIVEDFPENQIQNNFSNSCDPNQDDSKSEKSAHKEFDRYLAESFQLVNQELDHNQSKFNPLKYWAQNCDRYPNLSKVAMWLLSCPASCIQSDDSYVDKNWFVNCCRVHQSPEHVNKTLFVKSFRKL